MIHFFSSVEVANNWQERNPEAQVVAISAGHVSGSILVAANEPKAVRPEPESVSKLQPGRPAKVKNAI